MNALCEQVRSALAATCTGTGFASKLAFAYKRKKSFDISQRFLWKQIEIYIAHLLNSDTLSIKTCPSLSAIMFVSWTARVFFKNAFATLLCFYQFSISSVFCIHILTITLYDPVCIFYCFFAKDAHMYILVQSRTFEMFLSCVEPNQKRNLLNSFCVSALNSLSVMIFSWMF